MFELSYTQEALKQLRKLDKKDQERIISTLERIRIRPYSHIKKIVGGPFFRLRVGDYRVILEIDNGELIVFVIKIGHRKKVYK